MTRTRTILGWLLTGCVALCALPAAAHAEGDFTFGSQWWYQNHPESKYQEFRDLPRGAFLESFVLSEWSGRNAFTVYGSKALRQDQGSIATWTNGARVRLDLGYAQTPHNYSLIGRSPYTQVGPGVFVLPDTLQRVNQEYSSRYTNTMTDLLNTAPRVGEALRTDVSRARLRVRPLRGWTFEARGAMRQRNGEKPFGVSQGVGSTVETLEPIQQRTIDADLIANYNRDRLSVQASVGMSDFRNDVNALRLDNPGRYTADTSNTVVNQLAVSPDNRVLRGSLALGLQLPQRTALSLTAGLSQNKQNDAWLPYTVNGSVTQGVGLNRTPLPGLPAASTDAKAMVLSVDGRLTTRAVPKLAGSLRFNYHHYDNQTPVRTFPGIVPYDASWSVGPFENDPFGNQQVTGGLDLDYALTSAVSVSGLYEYRLRERTGREVEKDNENVYGGQAEVRAIDGLILQGRYRHGERKPNSFNEEDYQSVVVRTLTGVQDSVIFIEQPGLRRFDVAERKQDDARGSVSYAFGEKADLSVGYSFLKNDYPASAFGLRRDEQHMVTAEGTIHATDRLDLRGGYGFAQIKADQKSLNSSSGSLSTNPLDDWTGALKDRDVFVFAGAECSVMPEKLSVSVDYQFDRALENFDLANARGTGTSLPHTLYRHHDVLVQAHYRWVANTEVIGRYGFERFDVTDFQVQNVPLLAGTAAIFLGNNLQNYNAHRVALLVSKSF